MRKTSLILIVLVVAGLALSACGGAAPAAPAAPAVSTSQPVQSEPAPSVAPAQPAATDDSMGGMQHTAGMDSDTSFDVHFIDSTIDHHTGVIAMAGQALKEGQNVALKDLAQRTMATTQKELDQLTAWRAQWHPNAAKMQDDMAMGAMMVSSDASKPFDQRYVEAMVSHHQGSIAMAKDALSKLEHNELKQFAQTMITGEEAEIAELQKLEQ